VEGARPSGRNGHSATLIQRADGTVQILILGGWLGSGPLAAGDVHVRKKRNSVEFNSIEYLKLI
jgi:hypothetical protein